MSVVTKERPRLPLTRETTNVPVTPLVRMRIAYLIKEAREKRGGLSLELIANDGVRIRRDGTPIGTDEPHHPDGHKIYLCTAIPGHEKFTSITHITPTDPNKPPTYQIELPEGENLDIDAVLRRLEIV